MAAVSYRSWWSSVGDDGAMLVVLGADAADATTVAQWAAGDRLTLVRVL